MFPVAEINPWVTGPRHKADAVLSNITCYSSFPLIGSVEMIIIPLLHHEETVPLGSQPLFQFLSGSRSTAPMEMCTSPKPKFFSFFFLCHTHST